MLFLYLFTQLLYPKGDLLSTYIILLLFKPQTLIHIDFLTHFASDYVYYVFAVYSIKKLFVFCIIFHIWMIFTHISSKSIRFSSSPHIRYFYIPLSDASMPHFQSISFFNESRLLLGMEILFNFLFLSIRRKKHLKVCTRLSCSPRLLNSMLLPPISQGMLQAYTTDMSGSKMRKKCFL